MSISFVQSAQLSNFAVGVTTLAKAFSNPVTPGNTLFCIAGCLGAPTTTFRASDSVNGTWPVPDLANTSGNFSGISISRFSVTGSGTPTVTVTASQSEFLAMAIWEVSGLTATSPLDQTAGPTDQASGAPGSASTSTTSQAVEFAIGACMLSNNNSVTLGASAPWTFQNNPGQGMGAEYQILSAPGTVSALFSQGSGVSASTSLVATYKATGGGAGANPVQLMHRRNVLYFI